LRREVHPEEGVLADAQGGLLLEEGLVRGLVGHGLLARPAALAACSPRVAWQFVSTRRGLVARLARLAACLPRAAWLFVPHHVDLIAPLQAQQA